MKRKYELIDGKLVQVGGEPETAADRAVHADRFRDMVESRQPPRGSTDSTFFAGVGTLNSQVKDKRARERLFANAKKEGITLTGNEYYLPTLCRENYPLDPLAAIPHALGKAEIKRRIEEKGVEFQDGTFNIKGRQPESAPKPKYRLHPRLVRQKLKQELADPANAKVDRRELVEKIIEKHGNKSKEISPC